MAPASALHCGAYALQVLAAGQGKTIAVFRSTAYLANQAGDLLTIGPASMPPGPINLCIEHKSLPLPAPGDLWRFNQQCLSIANHPLVTIDDAAIWRVPALLQPRTGQLQTGLAMVQPLLPQLESLPSLATVHTILHAGLTALDEWIARAGDPLPQPVISMIGCGEGLTPAGDDLLCGYLVALHSLGNPAADRLSAAIRPLTGTHTSRISAAHLRAACDGAAIQLIHDLISAIACNNSRETSTSIAALHHFGHSSGHYAALGATQALACIAKPCHKRATDHNPAKHRLLP